MLNPATRRSRAERHQLLGGATAIADGGETADGHRGAVDDRDGTGAQETRGVVDSLWCERRAGGARSRAEEGTGSRDRYIARPSEEAGSVAMEAATIVIDRLLPFALLFRHRVW